jgi:hypothetical protein
MVRERPPAAAASAPPELLARGYAAFRPPQALRWWRSRPVLLGLPLAAAALLAVALLPWGRRNPVIEQPDVQVRGSSIELLSPVGRVAPPTAFRWTSPIAAGRFRLTVRDEAGAVVHESTSPLEQAAVPPGLRPGARYSWTVEALDAAGEVLARSSSQTFMVVPASR